MKLLEFLFCTFGNHIMKRVWDNEAATFHKECEICGKRQEKKPRTLTS